MNQDNVVGRLKQMMISRLIYFTAGLCALYMSLAPMVSGLPDARPPWVILGFWCGTIFLIAAAVLGARGLGSRFAAIGSGVVVALYGCLVIIPMLSRLGYYHPQTHLVAAQEGALDRWRFVLDKPVFFILLFSAVVSLGLSIRSIVKDRKREQPLGERSPGLAK